MSDLRLLLDQVRFARRYALGLLDSVPHPLWFTMPSGGVTHVAWQAGHLAFAQFRLALERVRGPHPDDAAVLPPAYFTLFGRDSFPDADHTKYPTPLRSARSWTAFTSACWRTWRCCRKRTWTRRR